MKKPFTRRTPGSVLVYVLVTMALILVFTSITLNVVNFDNVFDNQSYHRTQALHLAEAGVDWAIRQLNSDSTYAGETDTALGSGTMTIRVSGSGSTRTIDSYGSIPNFANPTYQRHVQINASVNSNMVEFFYGLQVDGGGLSMSNTSRVVGNIYSNGSITGGNGSSISGDVVVAGGLTDNPTVSWETQSADQFFATASANQDIAQSFVAPATDRLNKISVNLAKVGNPTSNLTVRINADNGGKPATASLASTTIPYTSVGLTADWVDATFSAPATVTSGATYWLILDYNSNSASNYWNWRKDPTDGYTGGTGKYTSNCCSGSPSWTSAGGDLAFRAWIGGTVTGINNIAIGSATSGTARANQFVSDTVHGSSCPNQYCIVDNPPPVAMPIPDGVIQDWKNFASSGGSQGSYTLSGSSASLGPTKINGNLTVSNGATLSLTGTVWVTGNILLSNNCRVNLDPGYSDTSGVIIADGTVTVSNGCAFTGAGANSNILLLTTIDAKNTDSMNIGNNATGVFYYAAKSRISFSNNATAEEATAWGIDMNNGATVTYQSGIATSYFSAGPGGGWQAENGTWRLL